MFTHHHLVWTCYFPSYVAELGMHFLSLQWAVWSPLFHCTNPPDLQTPHVGPLLEVEDNRDSKSLSDCYLKWLMFLPQISLKNTTAWSVSYYEHSVLFMYNPYVHKIYIYNRFCVVSLIARLLRKLLNFHFGTVLHVCNGHCLMQLNPNTKPYVNHSMLYVTCCIIQ